MSGPVGRLSDGAAKLLVRILAPIKETFKPPRDPVEKQDQDSVSPTPSMLQMSLAHVWNRLAVKDVPPVSYAITAIIFLVALLASIWLLRPLPFAPYLLFFATVVIGAGIGGLRSGLLAILLSLLALALLPSGPSPLPHPSFALILFTLVAVMTSIVSDGLYLARQQAEAARAEAQKAARRSQLLAGAGAFLNSAEHYEAALQSVAQLVVPTFAEGCTIDLLDADGGIQRVAAVHRDHRNTELLYALCPSQLPESGHSGLVEKVLTTGHPELLAAMTGAHLVGATQDSERLLKLRDLNLQSGLCVPLMARGKTLGAMTWVSAAPDFHYGPTDMMVANDLAARLGLALDNARLYQAAQQEIAERKRAEEHVLVLNDRLQRAMVETHHRVKNNLQIIAAMIDMRLMDDTQTYPAEEFRRLSSYVGTLAMVHDMLTQATRQSGEVHIMSSRSVLEKLLPLLRESGGNCRLDYEIDDAPLSAKQSTSLALVTNELVSNAIKHGNGEVDVVFRVEERQATLQVRDNGPGFPDNFDPLQAANTGLELVENLSRWDLGGKVQYGKAAPGGGHVMVNFALQLPTGLSDNKS